MPRTRKQHLAETGIPSKSRMQKAKTTSKKTPKKAKKVQQTSLLPKAEHDLFLVKEELFMVNQKITMTNLMIKKLMKAGEVALAHEINKTRSELSDKNNSLVKRIAEMKGEKKEEGEGGSYKKNKQ